ncbi:MAG: DUF87 domain-containing protein [Eubacterium sp.]|nr:DUF87 domain-containing protein [Eubacterium sp.]
MRLIPGKTKVKIEVFRHVTIADVIVGLIGLVTVTVCAISSLPGRWIIAGIVAAIFALLLFRLDDEPLYVFLWNMLKYLAYPRRIVRVYDDNAIKRMSNNDRQDILNEFFGEESSDENERDLLNEIGSYEESEEENEAEIETITETETASEEESEEESGENSYIEYLDRQQQEKEEVKEKKNKIKEEKQRLKQIIKEENKILKSKTATPEEKDAVWLARAERSAEKKKEKSESKELNASFEEMSDFIPYTGISDGFIEYNGQYFGSVIEIDPVEFRFFSEHRRNNSIENCLGKVLRGLTGDYGANIVKLQRPIMYDDYLDAEYDKLDALRKSYESGMLNEEELQARVEIQYDRINEVQRLCNEEKVIDPFYYLVLFETDKNRLETMTRQAVMSLEQGELTVRRLDNRGLALFLKYSNHIDFDEREIDDIDESQWINWAMPENLKFSMRTTEIDGLITHNMRVISYPSVVGDSWLAGVMSFPSTKVVVKITPMDRTKAIKAIDRSLAELRGQYMNTSIDSKMIELQEHINTLSSLLVTLQQDNEALLSVNIYITAYDAYLTESDPILSENFETMMPLVADMKKTLKRNWSEEGMRLSGMDFLQIQSFIGSQISAYDPMLKDSRGIPANTIAGMFPWIFAHISDVGGIKLGSADGVPVFIDFFRRDDERVNSNMVIVGKSGSGKSYATKSLLTNLASEDAKIFILDPENEYSELAHTLHGKVINVGNAKYGRLNPFHIITALDDDEAGTEGGGPGGSFATHLQFLEEFFRQILPDVDREALEYLNSLVERVYLNFGITPETDLSNFTAEDYPIFDDLYDVILSEFERTNNEYLRNLLRSLVNYISKFSTGGRNANIWNGPSTVTTEENFSVFNFQSMLANRNSTIANAQMLLVLKYVDNEIIKNRDYNTRYGLNRKIVVVIDEAHVFIDTKFPIALDFMFQLAKRIRKYNGMQIVITQNIKDFVGSEDIARKSSAIINACQYSFVFGLAPNDMSDLCKLYEKAGGINESEQEDILQAKRGQAFTIMSPTSRSSFMIEVPDSFVDMFEKSDYRSGYFYGTEGQAVWEDFVQDSRAIHDRNYEDRISLENIESTTSKETQSSFSFSEITEEEAEETPVMKSAVDKMIAAEEYVNQKEYELLTGRFGSINLQEVEEEPEEKSEEIEEPEAYEETKAVEEYQYQEESEEETEEEIEEDSDEDYDIELYDVDPEIAARVAEAEREAERIEEEKNAKLLAAQEEAVRVSEELEAVKRARREAERAAEEAKKAASQDEKLFTQADMDKALESFKESIRAEIARDIEDKFKWIALGASAAGAGIGAAAAGTVAAGTAADTASSAVKAVSVEETSDEEERLYPDEEDETATEDDELLFEEDEYEEEYEESEDFDEYEDEDSEEYEDEDSYEYEDDQDSDDDSYFFDDDKEDEAYIPDEDDEDEDIYIPDEVDEDDEEDEEDEDEDFFTDDEDEDFGFDSESEEYEPAPFLFAELLAEAADEYASMDLEERMEEMNDDVLEISVEELGEYIKQQRKKKTAH